MAAPRSPSQLKAENEKLEAENAELRARLRGEDTCMALPVVEPALPHHGEPLTQRVPNIERDLSGLDGVCHVRHEKLLQRVEHLEAAVFGSDSTE